MNAKKPVRAAATWLGAAIGVATAAYGAYVGITWYRYGQLSSPIPEEKNPLLDRFMPVYEVVERNAIRIATPAAVTLAAAREMNLEASSLVRAIIRAREVILGATPSDRPHPRGLMADMQSLGWGLLAEVPGREVIMGAVTKPWEANVRFRSLPPDQFLAFDEPGYVKIVWTIRADPIGETDSIFRTETRAIATDRTSRARFRRYWSFLSPGIIVIRWAVLGLVKNDAERRARKGAQDS